MLSDSLKNLNLLKLKADIKQEKSVRMRPIKSAEIGKESYRTTSISEQDAFFFADCLEFCFSGRKHYL